MKQIAASTFLFFVFLVMACQQAPPPSKSSSENAAPQSEQGQIRGLSDQITTQQESQTLFSSLAAIPTAIDSIKKFIRTAQLKGRVADVLQTVLAVENITLNQGGFVIHNHLYTDIHRRQSVPVSRDSAVERTLFAINCQLTLRVPYRHLDTTLRAIGRWVEWFDYRTVHAEDITFNLLEQQLAQKRLSQNQTDLKSAAAPAGRTDTPGETADRLLDSRQQADQAQLNRLKLDDQVLYSTITLEFYQLPREKEIRVVNTDRPDLRPPFGPALLDALKYGAQAVLTFFLFLIRLWPFVLMAALGYWFWKRRKPQ